VDEVALIRDTISHYAPVLIAPCRSKFVALASKKFLQFHTSGVDPPPVARLDALEARGDPFLHAFSVGGIRGDLQLGRGCIEEFFSPM
jgi:hypothetical protein